MLQGLVVGSWGDEARGLGGQFGLALVSAGASVEPHVCPRRPVGPALWPPCCWLCRGPGTPPSSGTRGPGSDDSSHEQACPLLRRGAGAVSWEHGTAAGLCAY